MLNRHASPIPTVHCQLPQTVIAWLMALLTAAGALGQVNPVYVDDSPLAREMFARAMDHAEDNVGEAVRLLQELLDDYPNRLITVSEGTPDRYVTVRSRILQTLRNSPPLLERYRQTETTRAGRLLEAGLYEQLVMTRPLTTPGLEAMLRLAQQDLERARFNAALRWLDEAIEHPDLTGREALPAEHERRAAHAWHMIGLAAIQQNRPARFARAMDELQRIGRRAQPLHEHLARHHNLVRRDGDRAPAHRPRAGQTVFDHTFAVGLEELIAEEIWTKPLDDSLAARRERNTAPDRPIMGRSLRQSREEGHLLTVAPTVRDNVVYINQGHRVSAIDRMSGAPVWDRDFVERSSVSVIDREDEQPRDLNVVVIEGDVLVTLTGHAYGTDRSSDGRIIRLDAATGRLVWSRSLSNLRAADGELDDLFPHSTPAIVDDQVIMLARRVSRQSLSSTYLVSFDLETGESRWVRHIVSSSATRRATRAFSTIVLHEGDVYISSPVGATARIDAATGHMRWLHRFRVGINPQPGEQSQRPWELLAPIVLDDRVIAFEPGLRRIAVLDRSTGVQSRSIDATSRDGWNSPSYLIAGHRYVISVGRDIRAFDPADLDQPIWQLPVPAEHRQSQLHGDPAPRLGAERDAWLGPYEPYGRVQLARSFDSESDLGTSWLIIPSRDGVRIVEEDGGHIAAHLPVSSVGNVLAGDAQLLVAGNDSLNAYMSLSRAEQLMRERVAQRPNDPAPALGLVRLGVRVGRFDLVMEASDLAMQAASSAADRGGREAREARQHRDELTRLLLETDTEHIASTREQAESLFSLIERIVDTAEHRAAAALKRGDWYADHDPGRAIETWQQILADRELGRVLWDGPDRKTTLRDGQPDREDADGGSVHASIIRPMRLVAQQRIAAVISERGAGVYEAQDEYSRMRVDAMIANRDTTPDRLLALARQFPLASAAATAGIEAAERLVAQHDVDGALDALAETYRLTETPEWTTTEDDRSRAANDEAIFRKAVIEDFDIWTFGRLHVLSRYVELAVKHDRRAAAIDMLHYVQDRYGCGEHRSSDRASELLASQCSRLEGLLIPGNRTRPKVGSPQGRAQVLDGRLVPLIGTFNGSQNLSPSHQRGSAIPLPPNDAFLLIDDSDGSPVLTLMRTDGREQNEPPRGLVPRWSAPLHGKNPRIILWSGEQILIRFDDANGAPRVASLSPEEGRRQWITAPLDETRNSPRGDGPPQQRGAIVPLISRDHLVLVRSDGFVAGFELAADQWEVDRTQQRQPVWTARQTIDVVHHAAVRDGRVILAGTRGGGDGGRDGGRDRNRSAQRQPLVTALDVRTGERRIEPFTPALAGREITWMHATAVGTLIYAGDEGVAKIDLRDGGLVWANQSYVVTQSPRAWRMGMHLAVEDRGGNLRRLRADSGMLGQSFDIPDHGGWEPLRLIDLHPDGDAFIARYRQRFVRYDPDGKVIGADMVLDDRADEWLLRSDDRFVLISNLTDTGDGRFRLREEPVVYRVYMLSPNGRMLTEGVDLALPDLLRSIDHATVRDGWLLATAGNWTIALPAPAEGARR